jgi:hypothetical protein
MNAIEYYAHEMGRVLWESLALKLTICVEDTKLTGGNL